MVMKWTSEPPTQEGWYFFQQTNGNYPIRIGYVKNIGSDDNPNFIVGQTPLRTEIGGMFLSTICYPHRWAGPIPEPVELEE